MGNQFSPQVTQIHQTSKFVHSHYILHSERRTIYSSHLDSTLFLGYCFSDSSPELSSLEVHEDAE